MKTFQDIVYLVESTQADVTKFAGNGNKAAGTRVRKAMQELKALAQQLRTEVQASKNGETE